MDDLRLFGGNRKPSEDQGPDEPREYIVYFFFFLAVTVVIVVLTHWSQKESGWGIGTAALAGVYFAARLISTFSKRQ